MQAARSLGALGATVAEMENMKSKSIHGKTRLAPCRFQNSLSLVLVSILAACSAGEEAADEGEVSIEDYYDLGKQDFSAMSAAEMSAMLTRLDDADVQFEVADQQIESAGMVASEPPVAELPYGQVLTIRTAVDLAHRDAPPVGWDWIPPLVVRGAIKLIAWLPDQLHDWLKKL